MSLISAIQNNNLNQLKLLLELGHDPNGVVQTPIEGEQSPLAIAYKQDRFECAKLLFAYGAHPDHDVFREIINKKNYAWCELFLEHGADPDCFFGQDEYDNVILKRGDACSPLHHFAQLDNPGFIELFLKFGADREIERDDGQTPLSVAARYNSINALQLLTENGCVLESLDKKGMAPLHHAVENCSFEAVEILLSKGADIELKDGNGRTPVFCLASFGWDDENRIVKLFLDRGANIDATDHENVSFLARLVEYDRAQTLGYLLSNGFCFRPEETIQGLPVLHYAIKRYTNFSARELVLRHVQINDVDRDKNTPLIMAVKRGKSDIAIQLIDIGVDINSLDKHGRQALYYAGQNLHLKIIHKLLSRSDLQYSPSPDELHHWMHAFIRNKKNDLILLTISRFPEIQNELGFFLHDLIMKKQLKTAKLLIEKGADVNMVNRHGVSPLFLTAQNDLADFAQLLIESGADVNIRNDFSITPLIEAAKNNAIQVAELLLDNGADPSVVDNDGCTALDYARLHDNEDLIFWIEMCQSE
jgi:ankyrin repeat protein